MMDYAMPRAHMLPSFITELGETLAPGNPLGIRGRAMGIASFSNWVCNYFVSLTFLTLIQVLGTAGTFWLYAIICFLGLWFVIKLVPETKGKTFEEIQTFWKKT